MKKRETESDVRAMAAALGERQQKDEQPPSADLKIQLTLVNSDGSEFTGSPYEGAELTAQIKRTSGASDTLYIGAVELVNLDNNNIQQIFTDTPHCFDVPARNDACALIAKPFGALPIELRLKKLTNLDPGKYSVNLRYSEDPSGVRVSDLKTLPATSNAGQVLSFDVSSSVSTTSAPPPQAQGTGTSTVVLPDSTTTNAGPAKPTLSDSPASAPSTTAATGVPTGGAPTSAPVSSSHGLSTGAKAGIGVGVAAVVLIVIALVVAWWVRRQRRASARNGRTGTGEKESVLAAAAPGGSGGYRDADEAGGAVVGGSPVTRKPVGAPAVSNEAALADAVSPASTTVGVVRGQSRSGAGEGSGGVQESILNAEERERWEEEERRLDEDIAEAERRRLGA